VSGIYASATSWWSPEPTIAVPNDTVRIFDVTWLPWHGSLQLRHLYCSNSSILRVDPTTSQVRATHQLKDIQMVSIEGTKKFTLYFYESAATSHESYESPTRDLIVDYIASCAEAIGHTIIRSQIN